MFDLTPPAERMRTLVVAVCDDQLDLPTPCHGWTVSGRDPFWGSVS